MLGFGRVLYTGADGLLGRSLASIGEPNLEGVSRSELDLEDRTAVLQYFDRSRPEAVIHGAALVGGVSANSDHPATFLSTNLRINLNVFEACHVSGVSNLISFVSTCAFPDKANYPLASQELHDGPPHESNFGYAFAKRMLEVQARAFSKEFDLSYRIVTPTNLFGPFDNFDLDKGHVIPSLIHRAFLSKKTGKPFTVWGDGSPLREFVFAPDLARALPELIQDRTFDSVIFSHGREVSIDRVARIIANVMGVSDLLEFDTSKPKGQHRKPSNPEEIRSILPSFQFTPLEDALEKTIKWFIENYPRIRGCH